jgi:hypothetical protein
MAVTVKMDARQRHSGVTYLTESTDEIFNGSEIRR